MAQKSPHARIECRETIMLRWTIELTLVCLVCIASTAAAADAIPFQGTVAFKPAADESEIPERFRLEAATFPWQAQPLLEDSTTIEVWDVTFPSPVVTPYELNNTVHAEYFRPRSAGKHPAVIVLHILGGDFPLSRLFCNRLAQQGVAALFVKMPYYGPRRDPNSPRRMVSTNPDETVEGMTQAVLDIRRATAWLASRDEVDPEQIGIFGISLGGITGALAASIEPRIQNVCLLLAGGDIGRVALDSPELKRIRGGKLPQGDREAILQKLALIDPVTYAARARDKRVLMLNATHDEVVPKDCTLALWTAFGEPQIKWYTGGHYSVIIHLFRALENVAHFFAAAKGK
jgi:dienelactone hydrolase